MNTMFQGGKQSLPVSHSQQQQGPIRRKLSSLSLNLKIQQSSTSSPAASWAFRRSKSVSDYAGTSIRKWWQWGSSWILSRKPTFATDLEMNEEEVAAIGSHNKGSWRHVFFKLTSHLRRKLGGGGGPHNVPLPRYDSIHYSKN